MRAARVAGGVLSITFLTGAGPGLHALTPTTRQAATPAATSVTTPAAILAAQDMTVLAPDKTIERELARGQEHLYRLVLTTGEYVRVIVEQRGIDVIVQARGPDGHVIADFQEDVRKEGQASQPKAFPGFFLSVYGHGVAWGTGLPVWRSVRGGNRRNPAYAGTLRTRK